MLAKSVSTARLVEAAWRAADDGMGPGVMQNSDVTYLLTDWDVTDAAAGIAREVTG